MAQGSAIKVKKSCTSAPVKKPPLKLKGKTPMKKKKGARYVVPKRAATKKAEQVRKGFENAIKSSVENSLRAQAIKQGVKPFYFASGAASTTKSPASSSSSQSRSKQVRVQRRRNRTRSQMNPS